MKHLSEPLIFRKKILIVDDEPNIIRLLIRMLASGGYQTESALNGFEAGIKITKFEPALVILDLFMPKMDGFDLCEQIKNNPDTAHIKVVAITGFDGKENRDRIMKAGANGYFPKPLNESDLLECIGGLLED